jgi:hypothetical protein
MSGQQQDERRRYFRVTDLIGLRYCVLSGSEQELAVQAQPTSLKSLLSQIENQIVIDMAVIQNSQPEIHHLLDLFNQKINLAFGHSIAGGEDDNVGSSTRACHVNLSACGIAFTAAESMQLNQHVSLDITLYPSNVRMNLLAAAISCDEFHEVDNDDNYVIRADFVNISESDQEVLVQHVIKRQAIQLKEQRQDLN